MKINGSTGFTGIIGCPVEHSLSPVIQNAAFERADIDWVYLPFNVAPNKLEAALAGLAVCGCRGLNVTMPHKQTVYRLVDEVDESAAMVKAVNTVEYRNERMIGHNTDGSGFIRSLVREAVFEPMGKKVLLIGAGGAAQSIALSLAKVGAAGIKILNRTPEKAEKIVRLIKFHFSGCTVSVGDINDSAETKDCDLIVNATSLGMLNNPGLPIALDHLQSTQVVYDIIYWPFETEFLRLAKSKGAGTVNGSSMLLYQGAEAFTIWTKFPAPIQQMTTALKAELEERRIKDSNAPDKQSSGTNFNRGKISHPGTTGGSQGG